MAPGRVLVLGDDSRSCLAIVRSLGRRKIEVLLGTSTPDSLAGSSRFVKKEFRFPSTDHSPTEFLSELARILELEKVDLVIPSSDSALVPMTWERERLESLARLAIPDQDGFEQTYHKRQTIELARSLDIPTPETVIVNSTDEIKELQQRGELRLPLIIKPESSKVWRDSKKHDLRVSLAEDWPTLFEVAGELLQDGPVLIQSFFEGVGVGQEFLVEGGQIVRSFQHRRIHEPSGGGGSSLRISEKVDPAMEACSARLMKALKWTGVAMVEYRVNLVNGEFTLMEVNGRFWGSLPLAIAAGADFPFDLFQLLVNGSRPQNPSYRIGVSSRNLERDAWWFKKRIFTTATRSTAIREVIREGFSSAGRLIARKEHWDELTLDDPRPGLKLFYQILRLAVRKVKGVVEQKLLTSIASTSVWKRIKQRELQHLLREKPNLLFVCRGNICRSPFAEAYAKLKLGSLGVRTFEISSAGTYPVEARPVPEPARQASRSYGVTLDSHRSRLLDPELARWAGAVVCMDYRDYRELRGLYPELKGKLFFLLPFDQTSRGYQIADPWGKSIAEFSVRYRQVSSSIDGLIRSLIER